MKQTRLTNDIWRQCRHPGCHVGVTWYVGVDKCPDYCEAHLAELVEQERGSKAHADAKRSRDRRDLVDG